MKENGENLHWSAWHGKASSVSIPSSTFTSLAYTPRPYPPFLINHQSRSDDRRRKLQGLREGPTGQTHRPIVRRFFPAFIKRPKQASPNRRAPFFFSKSFSPCTPAPPPSPFLLVVEGRRCRLAVIDCSRLAK
uniref:Uncharacterized protein n=1 Tax=Hordeum vulgare subsp. vulgare TaxID=112509 RepID=A0A8I7BHW0_HORVV